MYFHNLSQKYEVLIAGNADNIALRYEGKEYSYKALDEKVIQLSKLLISSSFEKGDVLCIVNNQSLPKFLFIFIKP